MELTLLAFLCQQHYIAVTNSTIALEIDRRFDVENHAGLEKIVRRRMQSWNSIMVDSDKTYYVPQAMLEFFFKPCAR